MALILLLIPKAELIAESTAYFALPGCCLRVFSGHAELTYGRLFPAAFALKPVKVWASNTQLFRVICVAAFSCLAARLEFLY